MPEPFCKNPFIWSFKINKITSFTLGFTRSCEFSTFHGDVAQVFAEKPR
jgi:hypothetical protein